MTIAHHVRSCHRKRLSFRSKGDAKHYIKAANKAFRQRVEAYYCTNCDSWHLANKRRQG